MKSIITRLQVGNGSPSSAGLKNVVMQKIPGIVAITGPNGAGKSRLLRRVESLCKLIPSDGKNHSEAIAVANRLAARLKNDGSRAQYVKQGTALESFEFSNSYTSPVRLIKIGSSPPALQGIEDVRIKDLQRVYKGQMSGDISV